MAIFSSYSSTILTVKQFPLLFNDADRQEFLEHFGAVRICCLKRYKNISNIIVADFSSHAQASQALVRLHQLELLCRRLVVEYCPLELVQYAFSNYSSTKQHHQAESDRIHGISPGVNQIHYPLPLERLCYNYPPIDESILSNISDALWSVPAFYTQVLHLMNKMSLPCPMVINSIKQYRTSSLNNVGCQTDESMSSDVIDMDTDDDESEIDDGEEERRIRNVRQNRKRLLLAQPKGRSIVPSIEIDMTIDTTFQKKPAIEFRVPSTVNLAEFASTSTITLNETSHGFGRIEPIEIPASSTFDRQSESQNERLPPLPQVPIEEIMKNRLSEEQLRLFDNGRLYRNYERGLPSQRLYIKNLNIKMVDERVLHSIYDRYSQSSFPVDIHLLREGKMKGQAFVTMPNENLATRALNETNGYVLHEKPMIVQFARSAKPKDALFIMNFQSWIHGLVGGLLISSCCIVQLFLNLFGIGCAGLNTLLLPYRPVFISLTIVSLTYAFYRSRPSARQLLAVVTFTTLLSFSPELLQSYNNHLSSVVDVKQSGHVQHWQIKGMHCEGCRSAVIQALRNLRGIEHVHVDLNHGRATISSREKISKSDVIEKIKSAGFHAEFID